MSAPFYNIDHLRLSDSTLNAARCARKLEFRKFYGSFGGGDSIPSGVGKALHAAYQEFLVSGSKQNAVWTLMREYPIDIKPTPTPLQVRSLEACFSTLHEMFNHPIGQLNDIAQIQLDGKLVYAIEVPFQINFTNFFLDNEKKVKVYWVGFIDFIIYDPHLDEYTVVDIKTHRNDARDLTANYAFDEQCIPYALVLEKILGHEIKRLKVIYLSCFVDIEYPKVRKYEFEKTEDDIQDWMRTVYFKLQEFRVFYQTGWFPRNSQECMSFKSVCPHFDYCQSRDHEVIKQQLEFDGRTKEEMPIVPWFTVDIELEAA